MARKAPGGLFNTRMIKRPLAQSNIPRWARKVLQITRMDPTEDSRGKRLQRIRAISAQLVEKHVLFIMEQGVRP